MVFYLTRNRQPRHLLRRPFPLTLPMDCASPTQISFSKTSTSSTINPETSSTITIDIFGTNNLTIRVYTRRTQTNRGHNCKCTRSILNAVLSYIRDARIDSILARIKSTILRARKVSINVRLPRPPTPPHTPPASMPLAPPPPSPRTLHTAVASSVASLLPYAFLCVMLCTLAASASTSSMNTPTLACTATRSAGSTSFSY